VNRKSYTGFRLVPKSISNHDLERRKGVTTAESRRPAQTHSHSCTVHCFFNS